MGRWVNWSIPFRDRGAAVTSGSRIVDGPVAGMQMGRASGEKLKHLVGPGPE